MSKVRVLTAFLTTALFLAGGLVQKSQGDPPPPRLGAGDHTRTVKVGDSERRYRVYVPKGLDDQKPNPVVVAFHGGGGSPESMVRLSGLNTKADTAGFLVVYPFGSGLLKDRGLTFNAGNVGGYAMQRKIDDVGFTRQLLEDLSTVVNVDRDRVYATGISNGGMMAYRVASELSELIAAVAPVGGPMGTETCVPKRPVSVIHFHGTADELAPFKGGKGRGFPGAPADLRPDFYSVDHSLAAWVTANGCETNPKVEKLPDLANDGMSSTRKTWGGGKEGSEVVLIEIENGGHTWPGREPLVALLGKSTSDISANDLMWEFFQKHPRQR